MPVGPGNYRKMKPNTEYALYSDGENGKTLTYYGLDRDEETIHGERAKEGYLRLQRSWEVVSRTSGPEGMYVYFKRETSGPAS
jgi:hypothetical protein